jgi:DHA1 family inner membrane transport protein
VSKLAEKHGGSKRFLILPFIISKGITNLPPLVVSLLLIEIAASFSVAPGIASQLSTASSLLSIIFALIIGLLSAKYSHKSLLTYGLLLYAFAAASGLLSGTLYIMLPLFALTGVARAMVDPMVNSLIGTHIPADRRTSVISYTIAGLALIYVLGSLSTAYLSSLIEWRIVLLLIVTPIAVLNVILTLYLVPSAKKEVKETSISSLFSGYREGLRNKSVLACLIGTFLGLSTWNAILIYGVTFVRKVFGVSTAFASQLMIFYSLSYIIGSLLTNRLAKKLGRRILSVGTLTILALFTILGLNASNLVLHIVFIILASFGSGMNISATTSLTLDQLPLYRGTVMSLQSAAVGIGGMMAAIIGGIVIASFGFGSYGLLMGALGFIGMITLYFFSVDPK